MLVSESELRRLVQGIIDDVPAAREAAREQNPPYSAWFFRVEQLVATLGPQGVTYQRELARMREPDTYHAQMADQARRSEHSMGRIGAPASAVHVYMIDGTQGLLQGLLRAIDDGLLRTIEDRVASEIYGDLLTEGEAMLKANQLRCAAGVSRVALENALRRLATRHGMADANDKNVNALNTWLYKDGQVYPQATFHAIEGWATVGNAYLHEENPKYTHGDVAKVIHDVRDFTAKWAL